MWGVAHFGSDWFVLVCSTVQTAALCAEKISRRQKMYKTYINHQLHVICSVNLHVCWFKGVRCFATENESFIGVGVSLRPCILAQVASVDISPDIMSPPPVLP